MQLLGGTLSTVDMIDLGLAVSMDVSEESEASVSAIVTDGYTLSYSFLAPGGERVDILGLTSDTVSPATINVTGSRVRISILNFNVTLLAPYESNVVGQSIEGLAEYQFLGSLVLDGVAGCNEEQCGPHGRCAVGENDSYLCECECGWTGEFCTIASGYCSLYAGTAGSCPVCSSISAPAGDDEPSSQGEKSPEVLCVSESSALCSEAFQVYNASSGLCTCQEGWEGPKCESCMTDNACSSLFNAPSTCSSARVYSSNTAFKSYTCDLEGTGLEDIIVPDTFFVSCNTSVADNEDMTTDGSYCKVNFAMKEYKDNPITCKASFCSFYANQSQVDCKSTSCECQRDCPELAGVFDQIQGTPCTIDCNTDGICSFDIKNFFVKLVAPCTNAECLVQGYSLVDGTFSIENNDWLDPFLASLPLLILMLCGLIFVGMVVRSRSLYFVTRHGTSLKPGMETGLSMARQLSSKSVARISFENIHLEVKRGSNSKILLHNISGHASRGELVGILGSSGSGKTSLLTALSASSHGKGATCSGSILLDDKPLGPSNARTIGYCEQDSFLLPTLTVEESIMYSAILRMPKSVAVDEIHAAVKNSMKNLGIDSIAKSIVGGSGRIRGISGGERKRVSVAMELVTQPSILLLDEPTSGLDSASAKKMVKTLKELAESGKIVMISMHQPSPLLFFMLSKVMLLSSGYCVYQGPPSLVHKYFDDLGAPCEDKINIADHILECVSLPEFKAKLTSRTQQDSVQCFSKNDIERVENALQDASSDTGKVSDDTEMPVQQAIIPRPGMLRQIPTLVWRTGLEMFRNPSLIILHWLLALGMGIFVGCVFWQVGLDTSGAQNRAGGLVFSLSFFAFSSLTTVDLIFHEKRVVTSEVRSGYYHPWSYYTAKLILDGILLRFLPTLLYAAAFYPMMGLSSEPKAVALFLMTLGTFAVAIGALSLAITVLSSTAGQASFAMNLILLISLLNSGFFVNIEAMADWISWLHYLSPFFYSYSILVINEIANLLFTFEVRLYLFGLLSWIFFFLCSQSHSIVFTSR